MNFLYANSDLEGSYAHPPMDVMAVAHISRFLTAFPDASYQDVITHVTERFGWVLDVPLVQEHLVELILKNQRAAAA